MSIAMLTNAIFCMTLYIKMNSGGLDWIQLDKKKGISYTLTPLDPDITI